MTKLQFENHQIEFNFPLLSGMPKLHGASIRDLPPPLSNNQNIENYPYPDRLTLMVIGFNKNQQIYTRTRSLIMGDEDVSDYETELLEGILSDIASKSDFPSHQELSRNFEGIDFEYPSYFTICIESDEWDFLYHSEVRGIDQFCFIPESIFVANNGTMLSIKYQENVSFFNAHPLVVKANNKSYKAVRCINYHKKDIYGNPIAAGESYPFAFTIHLLANVAPFTLEGRKTKADDEGDISTRQRTVIVIDPDGENKGPPPGTVGS